MLWIDVTYLKQLTYVLRNFKEKQIGKLFVASCPLCGDSSKSKTKARLYFFEHKGHLTCKCHNCQASMSFGKFLKQVDFNLYEKYVYERFKTGAKHQDTIKVPEEDIEKLLKIEVKKPDQSLSGLTSVLRLSSTHPAREYLSSRKIPQERLKDIYYVEKFFEWAKQHTDKFSTYTTDHARIVIPWISRSGKMIAFDARAIDKKVQPRYYHLVLDDKEPLFFGLNRVDFDAPMYVVEGSFDSMFIDNCIAVGTSALYRYQSLDDVTYIPDRDVRNVEVMKGVKKMAKMGLKVCMLPPDFSGKDLNEFIVNGNSKEDLKKVIDSNTYSGLSALNHFLFWQKCAR
jgi:transcription elongation factor Elf1